MRMNKYTESNERQMRGNPKNMLLSVVGACLSVTLLSSSALAETCTASPDCQAMGYKEASCPDGGVKCPWGNYWFCGGKKVQCPVGFIDDGSGSCTFSADAFCASKLAFGTAHPDGNNCSSARHFQLDNQIIECFDCSTCEQNGFYSAPQGPNCCPFLFNNYKQCYRCDPLNLGTNASLVPCERIGKITENQIHITTSGYCKADIEVFLCHQHNYVCGMSGYFVTCPTGYVKTNEVIPSTCSSCGEMGGSTCFKCIKQ